MSDGESPVKGLPAEVAGLLIEIALVGSVIRREGNTTVIDMRPTMLAGEGVRFRSTWLNQQMAPAIFGKRQEGGEA